MRRPLSVLVGLRLRVETSQQYRESSSKCQCVRTLAACIVAVSKHGQHAEDSISCFRGVARCCNWGLLA